MVHSIWVSFGVILCSIHFKTFDFCFYSYLKYTLFQFQTTIKSDSFETYCCRDCSTICLPILILCYITNITQSMFGKLFIIII